MFLKLYLYNHLRREVIIWAKINMSYHLKTVVGMLKAKEIQEHLNTSTKRNRRLITEDKLVSGTGSLSSVITATRVSSSSLFITTFVYWFVFKILFGFIFSLLSFNSFVPLIRNLLDCFFRKKNK